MKCTPSARVDDFSIRKANWGLLIFICLSHLNLSLPLGLTPDPLVLWFALHFCDSVLIFRRLHFTEKEVTGDALLTSTPCFLSDSFLIPFRFRLIAFWFLYDSCSDSVVSVLFSHTGCALRKKFHARLAWHVDSAGSPLGSWGVK